jgi:tripartite-type tricarboxylate transporter receptor subunit TctC
LKKTLAAVAGLSLFLGAQASWAQDWPTRPVQIIVPQSAGGGADILTRELAARLQPLLGQTIVVENKPGAGGVIGTDLVARAAPDGYTLVMGAISTHGINPSLYKKLSYDALADFVPVALVATAPLMVVTYPALPVKSVQELIAAAKANPGKLTFGSAGKGNSTHLAGELFQSMAGVEMLHVPFKGATPAEVGLMGGHVSVMFSSIMTALPLSREGKMKALAVTSAKRSGMAPELPTVAESGLPGFDVTPWYGIFAPAGTPAAVVERLSKEIKVVLDMPDVKAKFMSLGAEPGAMSQPEFAKFVPEEVKKWAKVVQESGSVIE